MDNSPMSTFQIIIVAICFILNMNDGINVLVMSFLGSDIVEEWFGALSDAGLSIQMLFSLFLCLYW